MGNEESMRAARSRASAATRLPFAVNDMPPGKRVVGHSAGYLYDNPINRYLLDRLVRVGATSNQRRLDGKWQ
jgi:hypothetical protein